MGGSAPTLIPIATHYETLGVAADATPSEIRAAYVARARLHHPDVAGSGADEASMASLNAAYEALRRPESRREYDRSLEWASRPHHAEPYVDHDEVHEPSPGARSAGRVLTPSGPARMPWKFMAVAAVIGSAVVITSAAFTDSPSEEPPDGILRVGSCVAIEPNLDAREVDCRISPGLVVRRLLPTGSVCPQPLATHRDRLGLGTACVEAVDVDEGDT